MRRQDHRNEMRRLLARRDREDLTYVELSEISGVAVSTLSGWSRRFRDEEAKESAFTELVVAKSKKAGLEDSVVGSSGIRVTLAEDIVVDVNIGFDVSSLARIIEAATIGC